MLLWSVRCFVVADVPVACLGFLNTQLSQSIEVAVVLLDADFERVLRIESVLYCFLGCVERMKYGALVKLIYFDTYWMFCLRIFRKTVGGGITIRLQLGLVGETSGVRLTF